MSNIKEVFRPTIDSDAIFALVDILGEVKRTQGLPSALNKFYANLDTQAYKIGRGHAKPAYVATGVRKESSVNLNSLGASADEILLTQATPEQLMEAEFEAATYNSNPENTKLPISRFIGKTWQQVTSEVSGITNKKEITDVPFTDVTIEIDPNKDELDNIFGKL